MSSRSKTTPTGSLLALSAVPHLRPPSIDHGVVSFLWGVGLGLFLLVGMWALGVDRATAVVFAGLAAGAIFLFVRVYGDEQLRR